MYLGKAEKTTFSGFDKQEVLDEANKYCIENEGWNIWSGILVGFKWIGWFKWKREYEIHLYKRLDYKVIRGENYYKINKNLFCIDGELYEASHDLPKDGDTIIVAEKDNYDKLIISKYPYNGLMGMKVVFSTKEFQDSKPSSIDVNIAGFVLDVISNEVQK